MQIKGFFSLGRKRLPFHSGWCVKRMAASTSRGGKPIGWHKATSSNVAKRAHLQGGLPRDEASHMLQKY
jgi:hypothetical protein